LSQDVLADEAGGIVPTLARLGVSWTKAAVQKGEAVVTDHLDAASRSRLMAKIGQSDTKPEMSVRKVAHRLGYRFRLHRRDLPGTPDVVFPKHKAVVFVHGCFWHRHAGCTRASTPATDTDFWTLKFERNTARDLAVAQSLTLAGWRVITIWECETRDADRLAGLLHRAISATDEQ